MELASYLPFPAAHSEDRVGQPSTNALPPTFTTPLNFGPFVPTHLNDMTGIFLAPVEYGHHQHHQSLVEPWNGANRLWPTLPQQTGPTPASKRVRPLVNFSAMDNISAPGEVAALNPFAAALRERPNGPFAQRVRQPVVPEGLGDPMYFVNPDPAQYRPDMRKKRPFEADDKDNDPPSRKVARIDYMTGFTVPPTPQGLHEVILNWADERVRRVSGYIPIGLEEKDTSGTSSAWGNILYYQKIEEFWLRQEISIGFPEKRTVCQKKGCGDSYTHKLDWARHLSRHFGDEEKLHPSWPKIGPIYLCPICLLHMEYRWDQLALHMKTKCYHKLEPGLRDTLHALLTIKGSHSDKDRLKRKLLYIR
jgi:hypothetical protein